MSRLPPIDAPLSEKLKAAMEKAKYVNRYGKPDAYRLAKELGTDAGLVYKWLGDGKVTIRRITLSAHQEALPRLLGTPPGYFAQQERPEAAEAADVDRLAKDVQRLTRRTTDLARRVAVLERRGQNGATQRKKDA